MGVGPVPERAIDGGAVRGGASEGRAGETLAQLGWFDQRRRVLTLRLTDGQWQTVQEAVTRAASQARSSATPEELLTGCLRQWLDGPDSARPLSNRFELRGGENPDRSLADLRGWLAKFSGETLFTVAVRRAVRSAGGGRAARECDELYRQQSAQAVRRLIERHGGRVRRVEAEPISASLWTEAIDRFGTCE
jgi:hypothetical protein